MTHHFIHKCHIRVWALFCDKKKVTEVFWVHMYDVKIWCDRGWRGAVKLIAGF